MNILTCGDAVCAGMRMNGQTGAYAFLQMNMCALPKCNLHLVHKLLVEKTQRPRYETLHDTFKLEFVLPGAHVGAYNYLGAPRDASGTVDLSA